MGNCEWLRITLNHFEAIARISRLSSKRFKNLNWWNQTCERKSSITRRRHGNWWWNRSHRYGRMGERAIFRISPNFRSNYFLKTQNTQPVEKNTQQNYATNLSVNASTSASASAPAPAPSGQQDEEPMEDFMRDILMIKPLTKESNVLNNTLSMSSDISNYSIDSINNR